MRASALLLAATVMLSNCGLILFPVQLAAGATVGAVDAVTRSSANPSAPRELAPALRIDSAVQQQGATMQWNAVEKNWSAFVGAILQRWPETTEEDLLALEGDRDRLMAYVAERHELTPAEADEQIITWLHGAVPAEVAGDEIRDGGSSRA